MALTRDIGFLANQRLSPRMVLLPSGSLVCLGVRLARTGEQSYHMTELPQAASDATPDSNGMVRVNRPEEEVFAPQSMASFEGVPVVLTHPDDAVAPDNWQALSVGHAQNVRRDAGHIIADLVLHDQRAIALVRGYDWRGVSAGYVCDYQSDGNGGLVQQHIRANHVALLPPDQEARCGESCAIQDAMPRKGSTMPIPKFGFARDQVRGSAAEIKPYRRGDPQSGSYGAQEADERLEGAERIMRLDPISRYSIMSNGDGTGWLLRHADIIDIGYMAEVNAGSGMTGDMRQRMRHAELDRTGKTLRAINAANSRFWSRQ
jgi:hypothetical protein